MSRTIHLLYTTSTDALLKHPLYTLDVVLTQVGL